MSQQQQSTVTAAAVGNEKEDRRTFRKNRAYTSVKQLLSHHAKLVNIPIFKSSREARLANLKYGSLICTTIRFSVKCDSKTLETYLFNHFFEQFRLHTESEEAGFEVLITFNAITKHLVSNNFFVLFLKKVTCARARYTTKYRHFYRHTF